MTTKQQLTRTERMLYEHILSLRQAEYIAGGILLSIGLFLLVSLIYNLNVQLTGTSQVITLPSPCSFEFGE